MSHTEKKEKEREETKAIVVDDHSTDLSVGFLNNDSTLASIQGMAEHHITRSVYHFARGHLPALDTIVTLMQSRASVAFHGSLHLKRAIVNGIDYCLMLIHLQTLQKQLVNTGVLDPLCQYGTSLLALESRKPERTALAKARRIIRTSIDGLGDGFDQGPEIEFKNAVAVVKIIGARPELGVLQVAAMEAKKAADGTSQHRSFSQLIAVGERITSFMPDPVAMGDALFRFAFSLLSSTRALPKCLQYLGMFRMSLAEVMASPMYAMIMRACMALTAEDNASLSEELLVFAKTTCGPSCPPGCKDRFLPVPCDICRVHTQGTCTRACLRDDYGVCEEHGACACRESNYGSIWCTSCDHNVDTDKITAHMKSLGRACHMCGNHSTLNKCDRCIEFVVETTKVKAAKKPKVVIAKEPEMPALEAIEEEVGEVKYPVDTVPEKPTPKPAPEEIIDLSSDSDEMADVPAPSCVKKAVASRDFVDLTMDD